MCSFRRFRKSPLMESGCIHEWTIEQFRCYFYQDGALNWKEYIDSEIFSPENSELAFFLRIYTHGNKPKNRDHVSVALCLKPGQVKNVKLNVTFEIEDKMRRTLIKKPAICNFDQNGQIVCEKFIPRADLFLMTGGYSGQGTLTICCVIEKVGKKQMCEYVKLSSCTQVNALSYIWRIKDFFPNLKGCQMNMNEIYSPDFSTRDGKTVFFLSLLPNGDPENHLSVYLHLKNENCDTKFNFAISIIDRMFLRHNIKVFKNQKLSEEGWGMLKYISYDDLLTNASKYMSDGESLMIRVAVEDVENKLIQGYHDYRS